MASDKIGSLSVNISASAAGFKSDLDQIGRTARVQGRQIGTNLQAGMAAAPRPRLAGPGPADVAPAARARLPRPTVMPAARPAARAAVAGGAPAGPAFRQQAMGSLGALRGGMTGGLGGATALVGGVGVGGPIAAIAGAAAGLVALTMKSEASQQAVAKLGEAADRLATRIADGLSPAVVGFTSRLTAQVDRLGDLAGGGSRGGGGFDVGGFAYEATIGESLRFFERLGQMAVIAEEGRGELQRREAAGALERRERAMPDVLPRWQEPFHQFTTRLREQIATYGMSSDAVELHRLRLQGLQGAHLRAAEALVRQREAQEAMTRQREADRQTLRNERERVGAIERDLMDSVRTPLDAFREQMRQISEIRSSARGLAPAVEARAEAQAVEQLEASLGIQAERFAPALMEGSAETANVLNRWRRDMARATETPEARAARILGRMEEVQRQEARDTARGVQTMQELLRRAPHLRPANLR